MTGHAGTELPRAGHAPLGAVKEGTRGRERERNEPTEHSGLAETCVGPSTRSDAGSELADEVLGCPAAPDERRFVGRKSEVAADRRPGVTPGA